MDNSKKIIVFLSIVGLGLMGVAAFGAFTGDTSMLFVAIICVIPVAFLISMLMRQYNSQ